MSERNYVPLYRDLVDTEVKCNFCSKNITSLKAYILKSKKTGEIVYSGPTCADKNIDEDIKLSFIPDLTKYTQPMSTHVGGGRGSSSQSLISTDYEKKKKALEYLELRENKFEKYRSISYEVLNQYYEKSKIENLSKNEINHIINIEKKAKDELKLSNLQLCYNSLFWIDVAIQKQENDNEFLSNVKSKVCKNLKITQNQIEGVNNWIKNIPGVPQIK